ncbi:hypothetical protein [Desulfolutivibrio sulfoxidireducens]|uniref:hypothetical protein n=1 Tax=Desulfolutivibrio sulfoxidireducens TaxID=2773299 RepID=UPI00159D75E8|nr:hypothetical protein [Desulfolutivibrio sulfoxidireducens]QLA16416.1 hypothetical protein GD605_09950 [Desulfolutivibrio sulfoxidireducens]QLA19703.1 hypothetical protein GD604_08110 [Desulfolutivibrio sulfoxidireducens]
MSINLTTIIQVMPYAQNVAHAEVIQPTVQQAAATDLAQIAMREEQTQVPKVEEQDGAESIKDENHQDRRQRHPLPKRHAQARPEEEETAPTHVTPWTGNIIDAKI